MKNRGTVTLVFDDGYEVIYRVVLPLLNKLHLPGVFALPLDNDAISRTEDRPTVPWEQWLEATKGRHEVAAHGISHRSFPSLAPNELREELATPAQTLQAQTVVYPGGAISDSITQMAAQYYRAGRTTAYGLETLPPHNVMAMKTINYTKNNFSPLKANMLALWAYATNRWLIETYHLVDDNNEESKVHAVRLTDLARHLHFLKRLPIEIKTIAAVVNQL